MRILIWRAGARELLVVVEGGTRAAVLLEGGRVVGVWPLPARGVSHKSRHPGELQPPRGVDRVAWPGGPPRAWPDEGLLPVLYG